MRNEFQFELEKLNLRHRRKRVWYRIISVLCSIAVFVTTYALILPAITLEASSDSFIIEEKLPQIYELSDGKLKECQELSKKSSINIESFIGRTIYLRSTQETQNIYFSGNTSSFKVNNSDYINFDSDIGLLTIQKDIPKGTTVILGSELSEKSINIKIINECNISFDTNGGNGVFEKITGSSDEIYTLPKEEPILKDKCFIGWKASDGTIYKSAGAYKLTEDAALIVQWKDIDYGAYESTYQKVLEASTLDELWSILGDSEFEDFWISLNENEQSTFEKKYQKLLNDTASQQELNANSETLSVSVSGKLPKDSILKLNNVSEKMSDYIKENLQGLEDELPFEVKLDTLDISVVDKYGHKFTPSEPLKMNIKKLNGSYDSEKYDLFVAHLMDDTLAIDKAIDSDTLQFAELSEESLPLFKDELNAVPSSAEKSDDSIAYTEHKAESNQDGSITIPVESFSIYQVASVNVTTGTYIRANSTIEMNVGESRVFYENTNEAHATWTVTDPTDAVLWNLHDPGKQIENEKWMQKYVWIKITAQHPADKITVTAKYGNSNKSEKFYISIPEPNFYIQNSIPKDGNISVHSDIQNVVSYKWSKESGKIVDEALYPNDNSRINVTIDIELTYSGTLMANADIGVEDVEKNTNTAELQWITDKGEYNDEEKTVVTYTFGLGILKYVANTEERTPLAGAKFQLKDSNGNVITLLKSKSMNDVYYINNATTQAYADCVYTDTTSVLNEVITPADGEILIIGLKDGGYQFVETAAPAGYNQLKDPVNVTVSKDTSDATIDDINCVITPLANSKGTLLPETGGVGTIIFISLGALIAVGAGLFLVTNKRMSKEDI